MEKTFCSFRRQQCPAAQVARCVSDLRLQRAGHEAYLRLPAPSREPGGGGEGFATRPTRARRRPGGLSSQARAGTIPVRTVLCGRSRVCMARSSGCLPLEPDGGGRGLSRNNWFRVNLGVANVESPSRPKRRSKEGKARCRQSCSIIAANFP